MYSLDLFSTSTQYVNFHLISGWLLFGHFRWKSHQLLRNNRIFKCRLLTLHCSLLQEHQAVVLDLGTWIQLIMLQSMTDPLVVKIAIENDEHGHL